MNKQMTKVLIASVMAVTVLAGGLYARVDAFGSKGFDNSSTVLKGKSATVKESEKEVKEPSQISDVVKSLSSNKQMNSNEANSNEGVSNTVNSNKPLGQILREKGISGQIPNLKIVVDKSAHALTLYAGVTPLKQYHVAIGEGGLADKEKAGDKKTPEGRFYIGEPSVLSPVDKYLGSRWMRVSYPNVEDAERGLKAGIIDRATHDEIVKAINNGQIPPQRTALGGGIGIHGGTGQGENQGDYWTWGCIGLQNSDIEDFFDYIATGTELIITA